MPYASISCSLGALCLSYSSLQWVPTCISPSQSLAAWQEDLFTTLFASSSLLLFPGEQQLWALLSLLPCVPYPMPSKKLAFVC